MRILITGGAGFIGSHLAERLRGQGHEVTVLDRNAAGHWKGIPSHTYWSQETCVDCSQVKKLGGITLPDNLRFDFIYHLAATVGVNNVLKDPKEAIENNIDSLRAVLQLGIPGMFASTSEVYGRTESILHEDSPLLYSSKTRWSYACSKLIGEWLAKQAGWKTVRFFNVVGPRQSTHYGAVLPSFVQQTLNGTPLTVYGDGSQIRTFIDVHDCVEILDKLRDKEFDVVNVGGKNVISIRDLAILCWYTLRREDMVIPLSTIDYHDVYPEGFEECPARIPDLTKLESLIGEFEFRPLTDSIKSLAESLKPQEVASVHQ